MSRFYLIIVMLALASSHATAAEWPNLSQAGKKTGGGENDVALLVAVSNYPELDGAMQVPGAVENLEAWKHWLKDVRGVPQVYTLIDKDVGVDDILEKAQKVGQLIKPGGTLWFLFIGHGMPHPQERTAMLMTHAANERHPERNSVALSEVVKRLTAKQPKQTVLIVDTCFAGGSDHGGKSVFAGTQASVTVKKAALEAATAGTITLTAGGAGDLAGPLPNAQKPAFSYLLLGGLMGWADGAAGAKADGSVTVEEAIVFANGAIAYSNKLKQTPEYSPQNPGIGATVLAKSAGIAVVDVEALMGGRKSGVGGQKAVVLAPDVAAKPQAPPVVECPAGTTLVGEKCLRAAECEAGSTWDGGKCVRKAVAAAVSCPAGTAWNGSICAGQVACAEGTKWDGRQCVGQRANTQVAAGGEPAAPDASADPPSPLTSALLLSAAAVATHSRSGNGESATSEPSHPAVPPVGDYALSPPRAQALLSLRAARRQAERETCENDKIVQCLSLDWQDENGHQDQPRLAKACENGHALSCAFRGTIRDLERANELAAPACSRGEPLACLAVALITNEHVPIPVLTRAKAARVATAGLTERCKSQHRFCWLAEIAADRVFELADRAKAQAALCALGRQNACSAYAYSNTGSTKEEYLRRTFELDQRACQSGDGGACSSAGWRLQKGVGTAKEPQLARASFRKSCELGEPAGCEAIAKDLESTGRRDEAKPWIELCCALTGVYDNTYCSDLDKQ